MRGPESTKESKFIDPSLEESSDDPLMDLIDETEGLHVHHFDYLLPSVLPRAAPYRYSF